MKHLITALSPILLLSMLSNSATAQTSTEIEGGNALVQKVLNEAMLPGGSRLLTVSSTGFSWTMDETAPIGNGSITCFGSTVISSEGAPTWAAGSCTILDDEGDLWTLWWTGADSGEWALTSGTGKYAAVTGGGTWANTTEYADGKQMNSWTGSFMMP